MSTTCNKDAEQVQVTSIFLGFWQNLFVVCHDSCWNSRSSQAADVPVVVPQGQAACEPGERCAVSRGRANGGVQLVMVVPQ